MATQQQLKNKAADRLGMRAIGQTLSHAQNQMFQSAYDALYDRLENDGKVAWAKSGDIPDAFLPPISAMLAFELADDVGIAGERFARLQNSAYNAQKDLCALLAKPYVSQSNVTDY